MISGAQRTADFRRGRLDRPDKASMRAEADNQEMQLMNWDPSTRASNRSSYTLGRMHWASVTSSQTGKRIDIRTKIDTSTIQGEYALAENMKASGRLVRNFRQKIRNDDSRNAISGITPTANLELVGRAAPKIIGGRGGHIDFNDAGAIVITGASRIDATIIGQHQHSSFGGVNGRFRFRRADLTGSRAHNTALEVVGGEMPIIGEGDFGNTMINGRHQGVVRRDALHALHAATTEKFDAVRDRVGNSTVPSERQILAAFKGQPIVAPPTHAAKPAISNHLSRRQAADLASEMHARYGQGSVRSKKAEETLHL